MRLWKVDEVQEAQEVCLEGGADEVVVTLKVLARKKGNVSWEEKKIN